MPTYQENIDVIDILYLCEGREEFAEASHEALRLNTNWNVADIHILSDERRRGPVAVMLEYLSWSKAEMFAKIDNDVIVPPGWLEQCLAVMEDQALDLLGIEPPRSRTPNPATGKRIKAPEEWLLPLMDETRTRIGSVSPGYAPCDSIGGIGLMRRRAFERFPDLKARGTYGGFTDWQLRHPEIVKGWLVPPLKLFLLDRLPMNPWRSLSDRYIAEGIQRPWTNYDPADHELWDWWLQSQTAP